jgi:hypothetical protein
MSIFGDKRKFAIEYQLKSCPYQEEEFLKKSWGIFNLWIEDQDICEYVSGDSTTQYEWNLIYIVEWLCNNLEYVLGYDPFPVPVQGQNALELIKESNKFECEDDNEIYLWHHAKNSWTFRHSWFSNRAGSIIADVYFRRVDKDMEVSWDNRFFEEHQLYFTKPTGTYVVSKDVFRKVVFDFLNDILKTLETDVGTFVKTGDYSIVDLRRKIGLLV